MVVIFNSPSLAFHIRKDLKDEINLSEVYSKLESKEPKGNFSAINLESYKSYLKTRIS